MGCINHVFNLMVENSIKKIDFLKRNYDELADIIQNIEGRNTNINEMENLC